VIPPWGEGNAKPWRPHQTVNLDRVESVAETKDGVAVIARRGGREYLINVPRDEVLRLAAKLCRPRGKRRP
jgi:hypothetical protein